MSGADGVFVTGTGTEVGKSVVAAVIARTAVAAGRDVAVFKPAVSGLDEEGEADHELLRRAAGSAQSDDEIAPYRYGPAVSPHLAAELAGDEIDPRRAWPTPPSSPAAGADLFVCEGVGGLLVPLSRDYLMRNLAADLGYPARHRRLARAGDDQPHPADDRGRLGGGARGPGRRADAVARGAVARWSSPTARRSPGWARSRC